MKKFFLLVLLTVVGISAYARKSYVNVFVYGSFDSANSLKMSVTGDLPNGILSYYDNYSVGNNISIGQLLNMLSQEGYEVEFMSGVGSGSPATYTDNKTTGKMNYLLSKNISSNEDDAITIVHSDDGEAYEVARYNLQGMQVNENTKGIQIIVYSNYTTKTVIVE